MSKAALRKLSEYLNQSDPKKDYRNKTINTSTHSIDLNAGSISDQIQKEVLIADPDLDNYLTRADYKKASGIIRAHLLGIASNPKSTVRTLPGKPNVIIADSFGTISKHLAVASDKVLEYFKSVLANKNPDYDLKLGISKKGTPEKIINLDHIRTVGETRIGRDLYRVTGIDPVRLITELKRKSYVTKTKQTEVFDNVLDILSYYQGYQKVFEIKGGVNPDENNPITGLIASGRVNQQEGATIIGDRVDTFREAVQAAIKDNEWIDQVASDSYRDFVFKTINNAVVRAGGTGKTQSIDTKSNRARSAKKVKKQIEATTTVLQPVLGLRPSGRAKQSAISLQSINDYINSRLPEQVRSNMGPGSLVNRTGRFSESARVVNTQYTAQGFPSIGYTYQRSPYDVFDKTLGRAPWNTPGRDPKALVETSIRQIARELAIGRFYLRRV